MAGFYLHIFMLTIKYFVLIYVYIKQQKGFNMQIKKYALVTKVVPLNSLYSNLQGVNWEIHARSEKDGYFVIEELKNLNSGMSDKQRDEMTSMFASCSAGDIIEYKINKNDYDQSPYMFLVRNITIDNKMLQFKERLNQELNVNKR